MNLQLYTGVQIHSPIHTPTLYMQYSHKHTAATHTATPTLCIQYSHKHTAHSDTKTFQGLAYHLSIIYSNYEPVSSLTISPVVAMKNGF